MSTRLALIAIAGASLLLPVSALAKRKAPTPVPPVVWQGVEYRVADMGRVQAVELSSSRILWETKLYHVWVLPFVEKDTQSVFITSMQIQDERLLVKNESGQTYKLDLGTGLVEGVIPCWLPWLSFAALLMVLAFFAWRRLRHRTHANT